MKAVIYSLLALIAAASITGCSERKVDQATASESASGKGKEGAKEEPIKLSKSWVINLSKDDITDKPKGHAYITSNEAGTAFAVGCGENELSYVIVLGGNQVFAINEVMQKSIRAVFRAGDKQMMEGNFPMASNQESFVINSDKEQFRAYLGTERKLLSRFDLLMPAGTQTFSFDITKLAEMESKLKAHCAIK